jgi:hypothetical protein
MEIMDYLSELEQQGWKTINLQGKSPDGIAIKGDKIIAVEVLVKCRNGLNNSASETKKKRDYSMFDDVFIKKVKRAKEEKKPCSKCGSMTSSLDTISGIRMCINCHNIWNEFQPKIK